MESIEAGGGLFSAALLRAVGSESGRPDRPLPVTARSISEQVNLHLANLSGGRQTPTFFAGGPSNTTFFVEGTKGVVRRALVIGSGNTSDSAFRPLQWAEVDAKRMSERLKTLGFEVTTLLSPTKREVLAALGSLRHKERSDVLAVFYSGHAAVGASPAGTGWIASDSTRSQTTWIPIEQVKEAMSLSNAKSKWYFIDADYSAELVTSR
jgi:Caspase domain